MKAIMTLALGAVCSLSLPLAACSNNASGGSGGTSGSGGSGGASGTVAQVVDCASATVAQTIAATGQVGAFQFSPSDVTISVNDVVKFDNQTQVQHTATSGTNSTPDGKWDTGTIQPGQAACVKFLKRGTYDFYCQFHPTQMTGSVTVQ